MDKFADDVIEESQVLDVRFPTALEAHGSDAVHDPDYSCVYVTLRTKHQRVGYGFTFTIGRGNDIVLSATKLYCDMLRGEQLSNIFSNFGVFWRKLAHDQQLRWLGPEKGVIHMALAAVINALWDLWAKAENKPLWKLLSDMSPEQLVSTIDFRYITDALTPDEAVEILKEGQKGRKEREEYVVAHGYPAYITSAGWLGYSNDTIRERCQDALKAGFTRFKVKVGQNLEDDKRRLSIVRQEIGPTNLLMTDANQVWSVSQAIDWVQHLAEFNLLFIEEPTSPDDVLGHEVISKALAPLGIGVATGEHCCNRVVFKQFLQASALQFCQIDSCRIGGVNEILAVYLMAKKFNVPVCPHAGGVGLCELVQHLQIFDFISVSKTMDKRLIEFADHLHEHFIDPAVVKNGCYTVPQVAGYSSEIKQSALSDFTYPSGNEWQRLFKEGKYQQPK